MLELRLRNYKLFSRCLAHLDFLTGTVYLYDVFEAPGLDTMTFALVYMLAYLQHLIVGKDLLELTLERLKCFNYFSHISLLLAMLTLAWATPFKFALTQSFITAVRFCLVFGFLDPHTTIPFQVLYTAVNMIIFLCVFEESRTQFVLLFFSHIFELVAVARFCFR